MNNIYAIGGILGLLAGSPAMAQNQVETRNGVTTAGVYAQQQIDLLPGFAATTSGFEAKIQRPENVAGRWSVSRPWTTYVRPASEGGTGEEGLVGIHTHVLPNGNVFSWEGNNRNTLALPDPSCTSHAYSWNPNPSARQGRYAYPRLYSHSDLDNINIFCGGHTFLGDGRLLVAGGHYSDGKVDRTVSDVNTISNADYIPGSANVNGYIGTRDLNLFDYRVSNPPPTGSSAWQTSLSAAVPAMQYRRWYPTSTTLGNGNVLVVGGQRYGGPIGTNATVQATIPEVYNATANTWQQLTSASWSLPLYPWMFLAPDGQVFNAGPNPNTRFLNPTAAAIGTTQAGNWGTGFKGAVRTYNSISGQDRSYGSAALYAPGKILIMGGGTNTAEIIDITTSGVASFSPAAPMRYVRTFVTATLLADGTVLATGGLGNTGSYDAPAVLPAELWTPPAAGTSGPGTWATMNAMAVPRQYHSGAVLLPDATVLSLGGGQGGSGLPTWDHPNYEIFTPPYLCKGLPRPEISSVPQAVAYGQPFVVSSPQASSILSSGRVTLVRLSSVTHSFNMNQRFAELSPSAGPAVNSLILKVPNEPNTYPPGHYMLFFIDGNGTPSHASIIAINTTACTLPLAITQSSPNPATSYNACDRTTLFTASGGPAGSTYNWTVNGVPYGTTGPSDVISLVTSITAPTLQVSVALAGNAGCGASSMLTSYFPTCAQ